jgi:hypothetical protein
MNNFTTYTPQTRIRVVVIRYVEQLSYSSLCIDGELDVDGLDADVDLKFQLGASVRATQPCAPRSTVWVYGDVKNCGKIAGIGAFNAGSRVLARSCAHVKASGEIVGVESGTTTCSLIS